MANQSKLDSSVTVAFETLGCKLNQAESESFSRQLAEQGCQIVTPEENPNIYILNTCSVTQLADSKSRHLLRKMHRRNPDTRIVAMGCYPQHSASELALLDGVSLIVNNEDKPGLIELLKNRGYLGQKTVGALSGNHPRTRSFIKVQDGCDNFCTYCIVPQVRGGGKSLPPMEVIREINQRVSEGFQEVVLTGTEIGKYQFENLRLVDLLGRILSETGIKRLRLSSIQPQEVTGELIQLWQNPRLCRHLHLSLQSGSDSVLRRMKRQYDSARYSQVLELIRSAIPEVAVTTDVIVGFPGETDAEFSASQTFCRRISFSRIHIFPYSSRPGTAAASMSSQVAERVKKERSREMLELAKTSLQHFNTSLLNRDTRVLFEQQSRGFWSGLTDNYVRVFVKSTENLTNRLLNIRLKELKSEGLIGELNNYQES